MPKIRILPPDLRNKIAAGEVVERPASVVKELIENSIDAGSTDIKIDILYGGKRLISVSDNGIGMDRDDALLCFERHATSKLDNEDILFNITTMGFRGEALSSIAAVSKMHLVTAQRGSSLGVSIEVAGGVIKDSKDAPSVGTTIEVRDLFYNTPARKKFLKTNNTELFHIIDTITKEALSHYAIGFSLSSDQREIMLIPPSSEIRERILRIYGDEFLDNLLEVHNTPPVPFGKGVAAEGVPNRDEEQLIQLKMHAFVSKSEHFRNTKSQQYIFINKRPIKDQIISRAVYKAYEGILPRDQHPVFLLFIDMNPRMVDFNVHPMKREVRFADKEAVFRLVHNSLQQAIQEARTEYVKTFTEAPGTVLSEKSIEKPPEPYHLPQSSHESLVAEPLELSYKPHLPYLYLGDTFLAITGKGGVMLIDHHAAHERVLYERFLKGINLNSHRLLFPKQVKLSHKECRVILENLPMLADFGIEIDDFGHDTVIVRSLPDVLQESDLRGILSDVSACILEGIPPEKSLKESLAAKIACHSSVRGNQILDREHVTTLLHDLAKTEYPDQCPHGRPTRIFLSLDDLKKMFKRK